MRKFKKAKNGPQRYEQTMLVERILGEQLQNYCVQQPPTDTGDGEVLFDREALFPNDIRMAVQVVASGTEGETAWTQGVLYDKAGNELGTTDVGESFLGDYEIEYEGDTYAVRVKVDLDQIGPFRIDSANCDDQYFYVDVEGMGTVQIKKEDEGIVVDIYPFHVSDGPVASTWAHIGELTQDEEGDEE